VSTPAIALAIGDPNGIGPEIAVKAAAALAAGGPPILLVGDRFVIDAYAQRFATDIPLDVAPVDALPREAFSPGQVHAAAGRATIRYVETAFDLTRSGRAGCIVACPHNETAVQAAGIQFSGYPSLVARLAGVPHDRVFLMLVGAGLRIVHVTLHERLQDAIARLAPQLIEAAAHACVEALATLGIDRPRIGMFSINPHAGEGGLFGDEDERVTKPAAERLRAAGVAIEGPAGADVLIRTGLDAFLAMYHDQGHIPIKLLAGHTASALSIGGGVLFSSVGHGSAFDIAGKGSADPEALIRTLRLVSMPGAAASRR
jgi:4-hydroxy-L-threonine phosphate dehydrogenase PdxA